ncbi:MAG: hypothetical protein QXR36_02680, partial [Desulfurococcaceae archaeon]
MRGAKLVNGLAVLAMIAVILSLALTTSTRTLQEKPLINSAAATILNSNTNSTNRTPQVRESSVPLEEITIETYDEVRSRDPLSAPTTEPLLAELVELDVTKGISEVEFEFNIPEGELFLAIDGSSFSSIVVKITIYYPDSTIEEYNTRAGEPLHKIIINPTPGTYKVKLSLEEVAWTRAWIQAVTLNNGVGSLESLEKQFKYFMPGEARYLKLNVTWENWVFLYASIVRGSPLVVSLWKMPEMTLEWEWADWYFERFIFGPEGEYLLVIRAVEHTDASYSVAYPGRFAYSLSLNIGQTLRYTMPRDVEFFQFTITSEEWFALDWSVEPLYPEYVYSVVIVVDPERNIIYRDSAVTCELKYMIRGNIVQGNYTVIFIGDISAMTVFKVTTLDGALNRVNQTLFSTRINFTQCGQSMYFRVLSNNSVALIYTHDAFFLASVLGLNGVEYESRWRWWWENAILLGEWTLLKNRDKEYVIRVQGSRGNVTLHLRPSDWMDYLVDTPDDSDFMFRFDGDVVVLGVSMRGSRYYAQFYAPLNWEASTVIWIIDSQNNIAERIDVYWERFVVFRYLHERSELLEGTWRIIAISSRSGVNTRVSHIQEGDEEYYVSTPYHDYHSFSFDYMLKSFKVYVPSTRWLFIAIFNEKEDGRLWMFTFNNELHQVDYCYIYGGGSCYRVWERVSENTYIFFLAGSSNANVSVSAITHSDLLIYEPQPPQTITTTEEIEKPYTVTITDTITLTEIIEEYYTVTEYHYYEVTVYYIVEEPHTVTEVKEIVLAETETATVTLVETVVEPNIFTVQEVVERHVITTKESPSNTLVLAVAFINMLVLIIVVATFVRLN